MVSFGVRRHILYDEKVQLGPYPIESLRRVERPTTLVTEDIKRVDIRDDAVIRAARGEFTPAAQRAAIGEFSPDRYPLSAAQAGVLRNLAIVRAEEIAVSKAPIPEDPKLLSRHIKRLGYFLGADILGICRLPQYAVYSHDINGNPIDIDYKYAIVLVRRKEYETLAAANGVDWINSSISVTEYLHLAIIAEVMASYIKKLGYPASPQSMAGGDLGQGGWFQTMMPPLLLWAGIGEVSRTHMILNPFIGLRVKASAVLTDLPLVPDKPIDFGLQDFCQNCTICAESCPVNAISFGNKVMHNGYETWKIDERRCASYLVQQKKGTICEICVDVCPWTKPDSWPHRLVHWANRHSKLARRLTVKSAKIFGPHQPNERDKWWFDLTYKDKSLIKPPAKTYAKKKYAKKT